MDKQKIERSVAAYFAPLRAKDGFARIDMLDINVAHRKQRVRGGDAAAWFALLQA